MPKKTDRVVALPAGLLPLLTMRQLETRYGVSDWQVLRWIEQGLPTEPFVGRQRRFDLTKVQDWMAQQQDDEAEQLVSA